MSTHTEPAVEEGSFELPPALLPRRRRLTERFPVLYPVAVELLRLRRRWQWWRHPGRLASTVQLSDLPYRVIKHKSLLLRTLGDVDMRLQHNKVDNLRIVAGRLDGLLIRPGEEFSFCRRVGKTTRRKGYVEGLLIDNGEATAGIGGGICQMANLLHWMALHAPLTITERSEHSYDPFPDHGRVLPWGVGCAVYYNYVDLRFRNDTATTFQLRTRVGTRYLEGELRAQDPLPHSYSVYAEHERFESHQGRWYRRNEIWRDVIDKRSGNRIGRELLKVNCALVRYDPTANSVSSDSSGR